MIYRNDIIHRQWFMRGIMAVDASILGGAGDIRNYFNLRKANDSLAKENSALRERLYSLAPTMPEDTGNNLTFLVTTDAQLGQSQTEDREITAVRWNDVLNKITSEVPSAAIFRTSARTSSGGRDTTLPRAFRIIQ